MGTQLLAYIQEMIGMPVEPESAQGKRMSARYPVVVLLVVVTLAVYWRAGSNDFVNYDDTQYVTANAHVFTGLTADNVRWAFTTFEMGNWHPLTWLSHMADCRLFGLNPRGHHFISVFLHIANTVLLFILLDMMTGALWRSAFVAALFALHPVHVESVAWIAERKDVLSTLFFMLALLAYVRYVRRSGAVRYLLLLLAFALGLMAKPMLVTLPFVLLLLDYWPLGRFQFEGTGAEAAADRHISANRISPSRLVLEKVPLFLLAAASSVVAIHAQQAARAVAPMEVLPVAARVANALTAYIGYLWKMAWPVNLTVIYPLSEQVPVWRVVGAVLVLGAVTFASIRWARCFPFFLVGWFWFLGTLVPVIGLVQVGTQAMADRYTYIPFIGLFIMIAWGIAEAAKGWRSSRIVLSAAALAVMAVLSSLTWVQLGHWKDSIELFTHTLRYTRDNFTAHVNLGQAFDEKGRVDEAARQFSEALRINPHSAEAHGNLANSLSKMGRPEEAIPHYREALRINPADGTVQCNLGINLLEQGKIAEAIDHLAEAVRIRPDSMKAHYNLGIALAKAGRFEEAVGHYSAVLRMNPYDYETRKHLESAVAELKRKPAGAR
jgi:tetratricopeptide (TPR) repeat protein